MNMNGIRRFAKHSIGASALPLFVVFALVGCSSGGGSDPQPPQPPNMVVTPPSNRAPQVAVQPSDYEMPAGAQQESINLEGSQRYFTDPDNDALTYSATSSNNSAVSAEVAGSVLSWTPLAEGSATITLTATDPGGLTAQSSFTVTVTGPANRAPEVASDAGFGDKQLTVGDGREGFDLDASPRNFTDPDGDALTYSVSSSNSGVLRAEVSGSNLSWEPLAPGTATVTVTATDPEGLSAQLSFTATVTGGAPDLTVGVSDRVLLDNGSLTNTVDAGASFQVGTTARNLGTGSADASTIRYYFSTNSTISSSDTQVGTERTSAGTGVVFDRNTRLTAPSSAGTYYYGACVDPVPGETNTDNNCSSGYRLTVESAASAGPDLTVGVSDQVLLDNGSLTNTVDAGASFQVGTTAWNLGTESASTSIIRYYFSTNSIISSSDTEVGTERTSAGTGVVFDRNTRLTAPSSAGTYYYGACVDPVAGESNTDNNCSSGIRLTVVGSGGQQPPPGGSDPGIAFQVTDGCNDGFGILWTAHEQRNGTLTGRYWPGGNQAYVINPGETRTFSLTCSAGTSACYGATVNQDNSTYSWGVGVRGDRGCDNCCFACPTSGSTTVSRTLTCPN